MVKISEYMAMSRPIVSYDLAESRFGAGDAAVFAASGDHAGFARLSPRSSTTPDRRAAMGAAGRERVERVLAWEHQERSLLAAYSRALAMGPAPASRLETLQRLLLPAPS